ncbi:hypothetical protein DFH28DRAFT_1083353 [Melampsora americana]|nr:hypothetical protein DFH28DRAFT_1083353 [Melampsora americana]
MNELFGDVNATADGIVGTQTGSQPITQPAIRPPANDPALNSLPAIDLTAEKEPAEKEVAENEPTGKRRADNQFKLSDGNEDDNDNVFCLPPPLKRQSLDDTRHHSEHLGDDSDGSITHTATSNTPKPRAFTKKTPSRDQAQQALDRETLRAKMVADHDAAKEQILITTAQLEQESLALRHTTIPSQPKAMAIFNKSWRNHFGDDPKAASEAILLFEQEDKCRTFINSDQTLRWSWLALSLGYSVVKDFKDEKGNKNKDDNEDDDEDE